MKRPCDREFFRIRLALAISLVALVFGYAVLPTQAAPPPDSLNLRNSESLSDQLSIGAPAPVYNPEVGQRGDVRSDEVAELGDSAARITEYWTKERLQKAIPVDDLKVSSDDLAVMNQLSAEDEKIDDQEVGGDDEEIVEPFIPGDRAGAVSGEQPEMVTNYSHTNGKVFFRNAVDGRDYVCSGSALNSNSKRLVATAGHCVHGGGAKGTWHQNWVFIPGYDKGHAKDGIFGAYRFRVMRDWVRYGGSYRGYNADVAFVTTFDSPEGRLVNVVGGHGIRTRDNGLSWKVDLFGYPHSLAAGASMSACSTTTHLWMAPVPWSLRFPVVYGCHFGPGASGGPWLKGYDNRTGVGYLKAVSSWGMRGWDHILGGAPVGKRVRAMYIAADKDGE